MSYRVLLVENDRLMLERLSSVISKTAGFELAARYQAVNDALGQGSIFKPNLILLDVDGQNGLSLIAEFAKSFPSAAILCMGEKWQADSASHFVQAGAKWYIVKPFTSMELKAAVESFSSNGMETGCETMTFFSPKGKSGKTTLIANLALALEHRTDSKVGIIDADLQFGDMAVFFNLNPPSTIVEAVRDAKFLSPVTLKPYFVPVTSNVHVLCGTKKPNLIDRVSIKSFENIVRMAQSMYNYLLIDVPPGFNPTSIAAAEMSSTAYLVSMINGGYEIQHMKRALEIFKDWPDYDERVRTIFTRVEPCDSQSQQDLERKLGYPVAAIIPNAYLVVSTAADNGRMALDIEPDSALTRSVSRLAHRISGRKHIRWDKS